MTIEEFRLKVNEWGQAQVPFLFIIDFEMERPRLWRPDDIDGESMLYDVNGVTNSTNQSHRSGHLNLEKKVQPLQQYQQKFDQVMSHLDYGDTFLINLTMKTEIILDRSLRDLFYKAKAKYKLWLKDEFLFFSPEVFVQIREGKIYSFPMKGTIDANQPDAAATILADKKELSEHVTIVDLIRNDLSQIASNVHVTRFRYIDELKTNSKNLLQVSSEIVGELPAGYAARLGDLLIALLPAGSICGAPKPKTLEIIRNVEQEKRGYYTGVFGYFDGKNLDSGVMIRFIEPQDGRFYYRSGGGITTQSTVNAEYQEMIDKIYVPVD